MESGVALRFVGIERAVGLDRRERNLGVCAQFGVPSGYEAVPDGQGDGEAYVVNRSVGVVGDGELFVVDVAPWA